MEKDRDREWEREFETIVMEAIVQAGDARSLALQAVREAGKGNCAEAERLLEECDAAMLRAHEVQTSLIRAELEGRPVQMNLLMVHAQDHVMNAMTIKDLASEIIEILKGGRKAKDDEKQHPEQMQHLAG